MRHSTTVGRTIGVATAAVTAGLVLSGCGSLSEHNDVLLFGADTKFALDVSADATSGGTPSVTFGYKRKEAVWMPLVANGACGGKTPPDYCRTETRIAAGARYEGSAGANATAQKDSYSVFASFGANLKGEANGRAQATVGLAQFFATGLAAQKLAGNSQVAHVLAVQPEATGQAIAAAAAVDPALINAVVHHAQARKDLATNLYRCVGVGSLKSTLAAKLVEQGYSQAEAGRITGVQDVAAAERLIDGEDDAKISAAVSAACK